MSKVATLVYDPVCPFAHRAWLTLLEKKVPFEKKRVDITNKSQEFADIYSKAYARDPNNKGIVPVLIYGDLVLSESDLVCEFAAEDFQSGQQLIPKDNFQKIQVRWFIKNTVPKMTINFTAFRQYFKKTEEEQKKIRENMEAALREIEKDIVAPYAIGEKFTMADVMILPWFERFSTIGKATGVKFPEQCKKLSEYVRRLGQRPSVQETRKEANPEFFEEKYKGFLGL